MRRPASVGLASLSTLLCCGILVGCGDNRARLALTLDGGDASTDGQSDSTSDRGDISTGSDANDGSASCQSVVFTDPVNNSTLGAGDDASGDACADGFQYTVKVAAPNAVAGASAMLRATMNSVTTTLATATVAAGAVQFPNVRLQTGVTVLTVTIAGMNCTPIATVSLDCSLPAVKIISPAGDVAPFADKSLRLLAATATQDVKDQNAAAAGAQFDVVACTSKPGSAKLFTGVMGDLTLMQLGAAVATVPALAADNCGQGLSFVAKFPNVTLPESPQLADGNLDKPTELRVSLTDAATPAITGTSDAALLWVDSTAPTLTERMPTSLCGSTQSAAGIFTTDLSFNSSTSGVTLAITNGSNTPPTPPTATFAANVATFANVMFPQGLNTIVATATELSGNSVTLAPPAGMTSCTVTVGVGPIVSFVSPPSGSKLCAVGNSLNGCLPDSNAAVPGWQNPITVLVTAGGAPVANGTVSISINMGAPQTVTLNASGSGTLAGAAIPEGTNVPVTVTTAAIPGFGMGTTTATYNVDTLAPAVPTGVTATALDRRQTSFTVGWTAPLDQGQPAVAGYDIHVKRLDSTTMDPCGTEVKEVTFVGTPKAATMAESVPATGLSIETDYCFTVAATDAVGNVSPIATGMGRANFNVTTLGVTDSATQTFGYELDGTGDFGSPAASAGFTNDRLSDLLVGTFTGQRAYVFFGRPTGFGAGPDVTFTGPASRRFGAGVVNAGDLDGDGLNDIAIGAPGMAATDLPMVYIFSRKGATWAVNGGWPATLDAAQASYTITPDASYNGTGFGFVLTRMGNFDGLGRDDLAITALAYDPTTGVDAGRVVIVKGSDTFASITLPDPANTYVIDGEAAGHRFGTSAVVLADGTLVASSPNATTSAGRIYSFRSPLMATQVADMTSAFDVTIFGAGNALYGNILGSVGPIGGSMAVVTASATGAAGNFVDVHIAAAADGTFPGAKGSAPAPSIRFTSSTTPSALGAVNIGGTLPGTNVVGSLVGGDTIPDLIITAASEPNRTVYIVSGASMSSMTGTIDLATATTGVTVLRGKVPTDLTNYGRTASLVTDSNGDGYADFALGEGTNNRPGRTFIFW